MGVNALVAIGLMPFMGFVAAALATSVAAWVMVWQLWRGSRSMGRAAQLDAQMKARMWRIVLASVIMGGVLHGLHLVLSPFLVQSGLRYVALLAMVAGGAGAYFAVGHVTGAFNLSDLRGALRRSAPAQPDQ